MTPAIQIRIMQELADLEKISPHLGRCRLSIEGPGEGHDPSTLAVSLDLHVPRGEEILVRREGGNIDELLTDVFRTSSRHLTQ